MGVRKVSNRGGNIIGYFPSVKEGRMVEYESTLERDFITLLDFDEGVDHFEEQPLTVEYEHGGKRHSYTPDFKVTGTAGTVLVECKPSWHTDDKDNQRKFTAAEAWCAERGWSFRVVTELDVRPGSRLGNVRLLARHARLRLAPETTARVQAILLCEGAVTLLELAQRLDPLEPRRAIGLVLNLAFHHEVWICLDEGTVGDNSLVCLPGSGDEEVSHG